MADISKIKLPGSEQIYNIKDTVAREAIAGGITFIIAWEGTSVPIPADIPAGVKVIYNGTTYTGTLSPNDAQAGAFYLVRTSSAEFVLLVTQPSDWTTKWTDYYTFNSSTGEYTHVSGSSAPTFTTNTYYKVVNDYFDEYVPVGESNNKKWEKLGDTAIDLSNVVTDVTLSKQTDTVIGTDSTFTITQPTITLAEDSTNGNVSYVKDGVTKYMSATASGGAVTPNTVNLKAEASGAATAWNSKDAVSAVTGYSSPSTDTFLKSASAETSNLVTTDIVPTNGTESVSKVSKSTSKLVTTSIVPTNGTESVSNVSKSASKLVTTSITPTNGTETVSLVTANTARIIGTTISQVSSTTDITVPNITANTQVSVPTVTSNTSVTANKSTWTFTMGNPLQGEDPEMLKISGGNGSDVTATNTTLGTNLTATNTTLGSNKTASYVTAADADVSSIYYNESGESTAGIPIVTSIDITPKTVAKVGSAVTVATGTISSTGTGSDTLDALTISNKTVAKAGTATTVATGSISSSGTGSDTLAALTISDKTVAKVGSAVTVATGVVDPEGLGDPIVTEVTIGTTGSALTGLGSPTTKSVIGGNATFTITQPTIKLSKPSAAESGVTTTVVDGITSVTQPTIKLQAEDSTGANREKFVYELIKSKMKGTASGANTAWNNKDSVTVLKSTTDVNVTKGNS